MKYSNDSLMAHAYGRTKTTLSKSTRENGLMAMEEREDAEAVKGSTACKYAIGAKSTEAIVRDLLMVRGVGMIIRDESKHKMIDFAARPNRQLNGCEARVYGRRAEIKTGGTVNYYATECWTEADILPNAEYVCWTLLDEASDAHDAIEGICDWTAILTREMFIELCERASRKGLRGTFHVTSRGTLSFQPSPLERLRAMIHEGIETGEFETLEGYLLNRAE